MTCVFHPICRAGTQVSRGTTQFRRMRKSKLYMRVDTPTGSSDYDVVLL